MKRFHKKQAGLSLIEALFFMSLFTLLFGGSVALGMKLMDRSGSAQELEGIIDLVSRIKELKSGGSYGRANTDLAPTLIAINAVPASMSVVGTTITNRSGGTITVKTDNSGRGFLISSSNLDSATCILLATKIAQGGTFSTSGSSGAAVVGTVSASEATDMCGNEDNQNELTWKIAS